MTWDDLNGGPQSAWQAKATSSDASRSALAERPKAILARQVATPNYEMLWFVRLARRYNLQPVVIEHISDQFTGQNPTKRALGALPIVIGRSKNGQPIIRHQRVVDPAAAEGQPLQNVVTKSGERLIDYHHRKLREMLGSEAPEILQLKDVLPDVELRPSTYYLEFFKRLKDDFILLEDFVVDRSTAKFFESTVFPAWRQAVSDTGRRPQIVRLGPIRRSSSPVWSAYPSKVADDQTWISGSSRRAAIVTSAL